MATSRAERLPMQLSFQFGEATVPKAAESAQSLMAKIIGWSEQELSFTRALSHGIESTGKTMYHVSGLSYASEAVQHGTQRFARAATKVLPSRTMRKVGRSYEQAIHPFAKFGKAKVYGAGYEKLQQARIMGFHGLLGPGFILAFGAMSPHGLAKGMAEETFAFGVGTFSAAPLTVAGHAAGRAAAGSAAGALAGTRAGTWIGRQAGKFSLLRGLSATTGARLAGSILGWTSGLALSFAAWEAARWTAGFALHTMPTFAKNFQAELAKEGFGGDYIDSQGAATMRQRSLQVMGKSFANARSALGQEAALLHV